MLYLLDTDIASYAIRGKFGLNEQLLKQRANRIFISWPTQTELLVWSYLKPYSLKRKATITEFLENIPTLPLTDEIQIAYAKIRADLQSSGHPVAPFDLLIAATALIHHLVLVTHNSRHFVHVPGLRLQDWSESRP